MHDDLHRHIDECIDSPAHARGELKRFGIAPRLERKLAAWIGIGVAERRGVCAQRSEHIAAQAARIERMRNSAAA